MYLPRVIAAPEEIKKYKQMFAFRGRATSPTTSASHIKHTKRIGREWEELSPLRGGEDEAETNNKRIFMALGN